VSNRRGHLARTFTNKENNQKPQPSQPKEINDRLDCFEIFHELKKSLHRSLVRSPESTIDHKNDRQQSPIFN
jgi:hypothetical protein